MKDAYGDTIQSLAEKNDRRIVLLILDGVGDCDNDGKGTALQIAKTPNLDQLASISALGLAHPVAPGITPGSGPGHLGLFGYDPLVYRVGRGVLSANGIGFQLRQGDVAARLNFATINEEGRITDRRAGRISTEKNRELTEKIKKKLDVPDEIIAIFKTVAEYRALLVLRGNDLTDNLGDTDPQETGVPPLEPDRKPYGSSRTGDFVKLIMEQVRHILQKEEIANYLLARGFAKQPEWPSFAKRYKVKPAAVAGYPMYKGISRLLGIPVFSEATEAEKICKDVAAGMKDHDFIFGHFKHTDKTGEDGDLESKVRVIEEMDAALPHLLEAEPDVLIITGDHSTPPLLKSHSWHPVPVLMKAPYLRGHPNGKFDETSCRIGELSIFYAREIMPLALAHAQKLRKFGA
jgi:2,3-bisphosphoglycerate-independent phosphoglycerate mutase